METREETEAREKKLVDDTKRFAQSNLRKLGINITNPLAGLDALPTTEESLDSDSFKIHQDANKPIEQLQSFAKEGLQTSLGVYGAALGAYGTVANQPRNMINITKDVEEIFSMDPKSYRRANQIYKHHEGGITWKQAMDAARRHNLQMSVGYGNEIMNTGSGDAYLPNPSPDTLLELHNDYVANRKEYTEALARDSVNPNIPLQTRVLLSDAVKNTGYTRGGIFLYEPFKEFSNNMAEQGRAFLGPYQAGTALSGAPRYVDFKQFKGPELEALRREFRPAIRGLGLTEAAGFNVHHIAALKAVMGIWDGLQLDSRLYREVSSAIMEEIPGLGLGDNPSNLLGVVGSTSNVGTPHWLVHRFYANTLGESGEKFFTPQVLEQMRVSRGYRIAKARELGKIIAESERIVRNAQTVYQKLYGVTRDMPEDLVESLHDIPIDNEYTVPVLKNLIKDIIQDFDQMKNERIDQGYSLLDARIKDPDIKMRVQGKRQLTPNKLEKLVDKAVKDAGTTYQPTLDPNDPSYNP